MPATPAEFQLYPEATLSEREAYDIMPPINGTRRRSVKEDRSTRVLRRHSDNAMLIAKYRRAANAEDRAVAYLMESMGVGEAEARETLYATMPFATGDEDGTGVASRARADARVRVRSKFIHVSKVSTPERPTVDDTRDAVEVRVGRYAEHRQRALAMADYVDALAPGGLLACGRDTGRIAERLRTCGTRIEFRDYRACGLEETRLAVGMFCNQFRLDPLCAMRRVLAILVVLIAAQAIAAPPDKRLWVKIEYTLAGVTETLTLNYTGTEAGSPFLSESSVYEIDEFRLWHAQETAGGGYRYTGGWDYKDNGEYPATWEKEGGPNYYTGTLANLDDPVVDGTFEIVEWGPEASTEPREWVDVRIRQSHNQDRWPAGTYRLRNTTMTAASPEHKYRTDFTDYPFLDGGDIWTRYYISLFGGEMVGNPTGTGPLHIDVDPYKTTGAQSRWITRNPDMVPGQTGYMSETTITPTGPDEIVPTILPEIVGWGPTINGAGDDGVGDQEPPVDPEDPDNPDDPDGDDDGDEDDPDPDREDPDEPDDDHEGLGNRWKMFITDERATEVYGRWEDAIGDQVNKTITISVPVVKVSQGLVFEDEEQTIPLTPAGVFGVLGVDSSAIESMYDIFYGVCEGIVTFMFFGFIANILWRGG